MEFKKKIETPNVRVLTHNELAAYSQYKGDTNIDISSTYLDEIAHNTKDHNGTELGVILNESHIRYGNNGNPLSWETLNKKFINYTFPKTDNSRTGFWGVGGSKVFVYKHGIPEYQCSIENDKYLLREWDYGNIDNDVTFNYLDKLEIVTIHEYEIDIDAYKELTFTNEFKNGIPSFFISIKRWKDCNLKLEHEPENIMDSLNAAFMNVHNFNAWFLFKNVKYETKHILYPTLVDVKQGKTVIGKKVPMHYSDLEKIGSNVELIPNSGVKMDIYYYKLLNEKKDGIEWTQLMNCTKPEYLLKKNPKHWRPQNPKWIFINKHGIQLVHKEVHKEVGMDEAYYTNLIFVEKIGDLQYSTIKTSDIDPDLTAACTLYHKQLIQNDKSKQYSSSKGEDIKVDDIVNNLTGDTSTILNATLLTSFRKLSNNELTDQELVDESNYSVRQNYLGREFDLVISNTNGENIIHCEFMNGSEDTEHVDGALTRGIAGVAKYNIIVVDEFKRNTTKRNFAKKVLENTKLNPETFWIVKYKDLVNGNTKGFLKLN